MDSFLEKKVNHGSKCNGHWLNQPLPLWKSWSHEENKCFTCHKQGCQPWKHSKTPWRKEETEESPQAASFTRKNPLQGNSPAISTTSARSITILVGLYKMENGKILETNALINSGAPICCIDYHLVKRMKWPLEKLSRSMYTWNANGTNNARGMIWYQITLHLQIQMVIIITNGTMCSLMQPASEPAGELARMRGKSNKCEGKCD